MHVAAHLGPGGVVDLNNHRQLYTWYSMISEIIGKTKTSSVVYVINSGSYMSSHVIDLALIKRVEFGKTITCEAVRAFFATNIINQENDSKIPFIT